MRSDHVESPIGSFFSGSPPIVGRTKRKRHHRSRSPDCSSQRSRPSSARSPEISSTPHSPVRSPEICSTSHSLENREKNNGKKPRHDFKTTTNMKIKISGNGSDTNSSNQSHAYRWDSYDANDCDDDDDCDEESGEQRQVLTGRLGDAAGQKSGDLLQCRYCSYNTTSWSIDAHFARYHKKMDCYYCQAVVYGHRNLFKHLEEQHGWRWKCKVCQMTFARRQIYEAHIKAAHHSQSEQSRLFC